MAHQMSGIKWFLTNKLNEMPQLHSANIWPEQIESQSLCSMNTNLDVNTVRHVYKECLALVIYIKTWFLIWLHYICYDVNITYYIEWLYTMNMSWLLFPHLPIRSLIYYALCPTYHKFIFNFKIKYVHENWKFRNLALTWGKKESYQSTFNAHKNNWEV